MSMVSPPLRQFVSPRRSSNTSSISDSDSDSDDDSIGPLPVLKRNKSLVAARAAERPTRGPDNGRKLAQENDPDSVKKTCQPLTRRRSIDAPSSRCVSPERRRHLIESSRETVGHLPSHPRRMMSLQATGTNNRVNQHVRLEHYHQLAKRRASVQPGAATRPSLSRRPDPPEQIRPGVAASHTEPRRKDVLVGKTSKKTTLRDDPLYRSMSRSLVTPRQPRRTASMPLFGRSTALQKRSSKPNYQNDHRDGDPIVKTDGLFSAARRSHSIAKSFARGTSKGLCNDVWVERMVVRDGKDPQIFFKAVFSKECKIEPPTGALNVVYMDELVKGKTRRGLSKHKQQDIVALSPVAKKHSFWGKARKSKNSAEASPSSRVRIWKSMRLGGEDSRSKKKGGA